MANEDVALIVLSERSVPITAFSTTRAIRSFATERIDLAFAILQVTTSATQSVFATKEIQQQRDDPEQNRNHAAGRIGFAAKEGQAQKLAESVDQADASDDEGKSEQRESIERQDFGGCQIDRFALEGAVMAFEFLQVLADL